MTYTVLLTNAAQREFRKLPAQTKTRIRAALASLATDPRARAEKLAGQDSYRIRVGDYRVIFRVDDKLREVLIARIKHRRDVYRR